MRGWHVTSAARAPLQAKPAPAGPTVHGILQRCGPVPCNCPDRDDSSSLLRRSAVEPRAGDVPGVPPIVREVLRSPGQPLASDVRAFYESRFGHDFSAVRLHSDPEAAHSARAVGARAYTVGTDIVLGGGSRTADMGTGSRLLAHELAHVVQQGRGARALEKLTIGEPGSSAEREAEYAADRVVHDDRVAVHEHGSANVMQRQLSCPELISPPDVKVVSGIGIPAHDAVEEYFRSKAGANFWKEPIPGASSTKYRTEDPDERRRRSATGTERVKPQTIGGRAGSGTPDLGFKDGRTLEVAEIKPATWLPDHLPLGIFQLGNYVRMGNAPENRDWRARQRPRIDIVIPMPNSRIAWPGQLTTSSGQKIAVGWCLPGLVGYRVLSAEEAEEIRCGPLSDQKAIDKFLNAALDGAQATVDRFIDSSVDRLLTERIQTLSIREGLTMLVRYARGALRDLLNSQVGAGGGSLVDLLPDDQLVEAAAQWLETQLGAQAEAILRSIVLQAKTKLLTEVRRYIKDRLHTYLQESFAALCAAAAVGATVSVAQLLKRFAQDLGKAFGDAVVAVAKEWAIAAAKEFGKAFAKAVAIVLLIAVAIVVIILLLPEILAALAAAGEIILAVGGAALALGPRLVPILNQLVNAVLPAAPVLQGAQL